LKKRRKFFRRKERRREEEFWKGKGFGRGNGKKGEKCSPTASYRNN